MASTSLATKKKSERQRVSEQTPAAASRELGAEGPLSNIVALQRAAGNRAVNRLLPHLVDSARVVRPKLAVSQPGDAFEQEADRVAEFVLRMPDPRNARVAVAPEKADTPSVQRLCSQCEEEMHAQRLQSTRKGAMPVHRAHNHEILQAKRDPDGATEITADLHGEIRAIRGSGQPMPEGVRAFFEPRFGRDFTDVRIHTGPRADSLAQRLRARAFTVGRDVVFSSNEYAPATPSGQRLLAHELTHVVQQTGGEGSSRARGSNDTAATRRTAAGSNSGDAPVLRSQQTMVQRDGIGALDIAEAFLDPKSLLGKVWLGLSEPTKAKWIDKAIDAALSMIDAFPGRFVVGGLWDFIKEGLKGFYEKLKSAAVDVKVRTIDKLATIIAGRDEAFTWAYLKGILRGFFIDGALGIFIAIWDLLKGLGKLWDFLQGIGEAIGRFPEEIERLLQGLQSIGQELATNMGPALEEAKKLITDPQQGASLIGLIVQKAKGLAKEAGEKIADSLLEFFSKPEASAEIGETVGNITGQALWEVAFAALTAGGGAAVTAAKESIKTAAGVLAKLLRRVVAGVLKIVEEIRLAFGKVVGWVKKAITFVKGKLGEIGGRLAKVIEDVGEFFAKLLRNCHESTLKCNFPEGAAKEAKGAAKGRGVGVAVELTEKQAARLRRVSEALKDESKWGDVTPKDRWRLGRVYDKLMDSLVGEGIRRAGGKVLHYVEVDASLIEKLRASGERVLITEGRLGKGLRFDMLEIDFAKGQAELIDLAATSSTRHLAKTRSYKTALETLLKMPVVAKEMLYTGAKGELLETLVEVSVK